MFSAEKGSTFPSDRRVGAPFTGLKKFLYQVRFPFTRCEPSLVSLINSLVHESNDTRTHVTTD